MRTIQSKVLGWQPELNGAAIRAKFRVATETERDQFVNGALKIPGVSLVAPPSS